MAEQWTKGPWSVHNLWTGDGGKGPFAYPLGPDPDVAVANARLIAAAPDLVGALETFVTQATKLSGFPAQYDPYVGALVKARTALAKARGEG